jgi:transcriptional regulator with XRE-family HTH domain
MSVGDAPRGRTLADKLDCLFRTIHTRREGEYSYEEVAKALRRKGGPTISATYIWQLRKGLRDNPTKRHIEALAEFFGVSPAYFFDDEAAERIGEELELLAGLRDAQVRELALRAFGLSSDSLAAIRGIVERVRKLEGLDKEPRPEQAPAAVLSEASSEDKA